MKINNPPVQSIARVQKNHRQRGFGELSGLTQSVLESWHSVGITFLLNCGQFFGNNEREFSSFEK
jgi:hypothetical protein